MAAVAPQEEGNMGWMPQTQPEPPMNTISPESEHALQEKYDQMMRGIEEQQHTLQKLMEAQRTIEERQHKTMVNIIDIQIHWVMRSLFI